LPALSRRHMCEGVLCPKQSPKGLPLPDNRGLLHRQKRAVRNDITQGGLDESGVITLWVETSATGQKTDYAGLGIL